MNLILELLDAAKCADSRANNGSATRIVTDLPKAYGRRYQVGISFHPFDS